MTGDDRDICQEHTNILEQLRVLLDNYQKGSAQEFAEPLRNQSELDRYFRTRHFHKNFFTNYHAFWSLFCKNEVKIPDNFYVYDVACGPFTATISLLNFLRNHNAISGKKFIFVFCDLPEGYWLLEKVWQMNYYTSNGSFSFPLDKFYVSEFVSKKITKEFPKNGDWPVYRNKCPSKWSRCYEPIVISAELRNAINLILCSYPGKTLNIDFGGKRFIDCIEKTIKDLSLYQKRLPTYIIYSHYLPDDPSRNWKQESIKALKDINLIYFDDNRNCEVPFSNCYYCIFRN